MFTVDDLPYDYQALEPFVDEATMKLHHDKHHAAYVKNLNDALAGQADLLKMDIAELLQNLDKVPEDIRTKVKNNGGGHYNHTLFWNILTPPKDQQPSGKLLEAINQAFDSFEEFKKQFADKGLGRFGSGWVWLIVKDGKLEITDTPNQDSPIMEGITPILGLDVWEHAYYLKYQNRRAEYIEAWWNVVNWAEVEKSLAEISQK